MTHFLWNIHDTAPDSQRFPQYFVNILRIFPTVLFLLSVSVSTISAIPQGAYHSYIISCICTHELSSPVHFLMALSILSFGTHSFFAFCIAAKRLGLSSGFHHFWAASAISFAWIENIFPFTAFTAFLRAWTTGPLHIFIEFKKIDIELYGTAFRTFVKKIKKLLQELSFCIELRGLFSKEITHGYICYNSWHQDKRWKGFYY